MKLSILIASIPSRLTNGLKPLMDEIERQIGDKSVEILALTDNKRRTIGMKKEVLVQAANGKYLAFIDDDDMVCEGYIDEILAHVDSGVDVIHWQQKCILNNENPFICYHGLKHSNQEAHKKNGRWVDITRQPSHTSAWKAELAKRHHFNDVSYWEDWDWAKRLVAEAKTEINIPKVLSIYEWSAKTTEAIPTAKKVA